MATLTKSKPATTVISASLLIETVEELNAIVKRNPELSRSRLIQLATEAYLGSIKEGNVEGVKPGKGAKRRLSGRTNYAALRSA